MFLQDFGFSFVPLNPFGVLIFLPAGGSGSGHGAEGESGYFSEVLRARISKHPIFTDMRFWQHVLKEAVQAKTEKVHTIKGIRKKGYGIKESG